MLGRTELRVLDYMGRVVYVQKTVYNEYWLPQIKNLHKESNHPLAVKVFERAGKLNNIIKAKHFTVKEFVHVGFHKKLIYTYLKNLEEHELIKSERIGDRIPSDRKDSFFKALKKIDIMVKKEAKRKKTVLPKQSYAKKRYYITRKGCEIAELMSLDHTPTYLKNINEDMKPMFNL